MEIKGWINITTKRSEMVDPKSHLATQEHFGWTTGDLAIWREWDWANDDGGETLIVRTGPDDPDTMADDLRMEILVRWPTQQEARVAFSTTIPTFT